MSVTKFRTRTKQRYEHVERLPAMSRRIWFRQQATVSLFRNRKIREVAQKLHKYFGGGKQ
jgi:hypothetical protein